MAGEAERRLVVGAAAPRDQAGAPVGELVRGNGETRVGQKPAETVGAGPFVAGRIAGVEGDELPRQFEGVRHGAHGLFSSPPPK